MEGSDLGLEQEIVSYLYHFKNTRESDLILYGVQRLGQTEESMRKLVDKMALMKWVEKVVHEKIDPPATYVGLDLEVPLELELQAVCDSLGHPRLLKQEIAKAKQFLEKGMSERRV